MVNVRLAEDWTDGNGTAHAAGDRVDVDSGTLAKLERAGIVGGPNPPSGAGRDDESDDDWTGPTAGSPPPGPDIDDDVW